MSWATVAVGLALAAAGGAVSYSNTKRTERNTDNALFNQISTQRREQQKADAKVNEQVQELEASTSADEQAARQTEYMDNLRAKTGNLTAGLTPAIGSAAFRADAAGDAADVTQYAADTAGLMSRIDAANLQRQGESFGFGNLATDLNLIGREASGLNWLDELRVKRASQRNAGLDALAAFLGGAGGAVAGMGGSGGGTTGYTAPSGMTYNVPVTSGGYGWHNAYGG